MGIARFYRFLSERYPLINEALEGDAESFPIFDNLYLDLNGVIHNCSHGNDPSRAGQSNEEIFLAVFQYINRLVHNTRPQRLVYLAIDGVAPRAKMNQQRSRRFRAAADRPTDGGQFDSNQITPGTEFMEQLTGHLSFFIAARLEEDPIWRGLQVVLSGPEVPGEGEHKIMDFIRSEKHKTQALKPQTWPTTRHCLYGLDADLIMLGLSSHEPQFSLLREEVVFASAKTQDGERMLVKKDKFQLLHLGVLREYLAMEFGIVGMPGERKLRGEAEYLMNKDELRMLDRVIDDFILICFLIGNDFLPHIPLTEVSEGGLDRLLTAYKETCLGMQGVSSDDGILAAFSGGAEAQEPAGERKYLTEQTGLVNWDNLEIFLEAYGRTEDERLADTIASGQWLVGQRRMCGDHPQAKGFEDWFAANGRKKGNRSVSNEKARNEYYEKKFDKGVTKLHIVKEYLQGLQWNLFYYFRGVQDWGWFYPHFAAPFIGDLVREVRAQGLSLPEIAKSFRFELGRPFRPFEQLMGVLPASSGKKFLPDVLSRLMTDSPEIREFYPRSFEVDMDGVSVEWGGVVLLPFVGEQKLLTAIDAVAHHLTEAEKKRNSTGTAYIFRRANSPNQGRIQSSMPAHLPSVEGETHVVQTTFSHPKIPAGETFPNVTFDLVPDRKFPSLLRIPVAGELMPGFGVRVFGRESRNVSLVVIIDPVTAADLVQAQSGGDGVIALAQNLIDRKSQVDFPFVHVGTVKRVLTNSTVYSRAKTNQNMIETHPRTNQEQDWDFNDICSRLRCQGVAVEPRPDAILVELTDGTLRLASMVKALSSVAATPQTKRSDANEELFVGDFNDPLFGVLARKRSGGMFVATCESDSSNFVDSARLAVGGTRSVAVPEVWRNIHVLARELSTQPAVVQAVLGSFAVRYRGDREDIGLRLFIVRGRGGAQQSVSSLCCVGFSRLDVRSNEWQFSNKTLTLLQEYFALVPGFAARLGELLRRSASGVPAAKELFDGEVDKQVANVVGFIKKKVVSLPHVPVGHEALDHSQVAALEETIEQHRSKSDVIEAEFIRKQLVTRDEILRKFSMKTQFRDNFRSASKSVVKLGSRVRVYLTGVPSGARGTVVAIYAFQDGAVQLEVLLDKKTLGAASLHGRSSNLRGVVATPDNLVLLAPAKSKPPQLSKDKVPASLKPVQATDNRPSTSPALAQPPQASELPLPSFLKF